MHVPMVFVLGQGWVLYPAVARRDCCLARDLCCGLKKAISVALEGIRPIRLSALL